VPAPEQAEIIRWSQATAADLIHRNERMPSAHLVQSLAALRSGRVSDAIEFAGEAIKAQPTTSPIAACTVLAPAYLIRSMAHERLGHDEPARSDRARALALFRTDIPRPFGSHWQEMAFIDGLICAAERETGRAVVPVFPE
jgi:hypothetical protein